MAAIVENVLRQASLSLEAGVSSATAIAGAWRDIPHFRCIGRRNLDRLDTGGGLGHQYTRHFRLAAPTPVSGVGSHSDTAHPAQCCDGPVQVHERRPIQPSLWPIRGAMYID